MYAVSDNGIREKEKEPAIRGKIKNRKAEELAYVSRNVRICQHGKYGTDPDGIEPYGIRPSGAIGFQARYLLVTVLAAVMLWSDAQRQRLSADTGTRTRRKTVETVCSRQIRDS